MLDQQLGGSASTWEPVSFDLDNSQGGAFSGHPAAESELEIQGHEPN